MNRTQIKKIYDKAELGKYAIGAFNFSTMEILHAITNAAVKLKSPLIISCSEGERKFFGTDEAVAVWDVLNKKLKTNFILHADHHKSFETIKECIDAGFPSVHIDASHLDYKDNLKVTKKVVDYAHKKNVWVEAELGHIGGASTLHDVDISTVTGPEFMTDPNQSKEFVEKTGTDALATNIGNAHGVWKGKPHLAFNRISKIKELTKKPLVLHGGSGIDTASFERAIRLGIDKVNINSDMRIAYADTLTKSLLKRRNYTPYAYMQESMEAVEEVVTEKINIFGSKNKL